MTSVEIRNLRRADTAASAQLHGEVLDMEISTRCGPRFLDRIQTFAVAASGESSWRKPAESGNEQASTNLSS